MASETIIPQIKNLEHGKDREPRGNISSQTIGRYIEKFKIRKNTEAARDNTAYI